MNPSGIGLEGVAYGIFVAAAVFHLITHRRHMAATIRAVFSKPPQEPESGEPASYRSLYASELEKSLAVKATFI